MSKKPKTQQPRTTDWFDGMKFYPGTSGVYAIISKVDGWAKYSYFNAKTKKWNGGWPTADGAYEKRNWHKETGAEGCIDWMVEAKDFRFRGLKDKS